MTSLSGLLLEESIGAPRSALNRRSSTRYRKQDHAGYRPSYVFQPPPDARLYCALWRPFNPPSLPPCRPMPRALWFAGRASRARTVVTHVERPGCMRATIQSGILVRPSDKGGSDHLLVRVTGSDMQRVHHATSLITMPGSGPTEKALTNHGRILQRRPPRPSLRLRWGLWGTR